MNLNIYLDFLFYVERKFTSKSKLTENVGNDE